MRTRAGVCEGDDDGYYDKGLALGDTSKARGKDLRRERVERVGGDDGRGQQSFTLGCKWFLSGGGESWSDE